MSVIEDSFQHLIAEQTAPELLIARAMIGKLSRQGFIKEENTATAVEQLSEYFRQLAGNRSILDVWDEEENLPFKIDDNLLELKAGESFEVVRMELTPEDIEAQNSLVYQFIPALMSQSVREVAEELTLAWRSDFQNALQSIATEQHRFETVLRDIWGNALNQFSVFIDLSLHLGNELNRQFSDQALKANNYKFDALRRIHARSCQTAGEILSLLKSGYADGANARWRTLHESAVIGEILSKNDQITARRFLEYSIVEEYELMTVYQRQAKRSGWSAINPKRVNFIEKLRTKLMNDYGPEFSAPYGWASHIIHPSRGRWILFWQLEEEARRQEYQYAHNMAHKSVHSSSFGMQYPLASSPIAPNVLVAGGSIYGLSEPGIQTAQALSAITANLLRVRENLDDIVSLKAFFSLRDDVWSAFRFAEASLEEATQNYTKRRKIRKIRIIRSSH